MVIITMIKALINTRGPNRSEEPLRDVFACIYVAHVGYTYVCIETERKESEVHHPHVYVISLTKQQ